MFRRFLLFAGLTAALCVCAGHASAQPRRGYAWERPATEQCRAQSASAPAALPSADAIERKLREAFPVAFRDQPLRDILDDISHASKLKFVLNEKALEAQGIDPSFPLTLSAEGISLRSVLKLILNQAHLTYVIRDGAIEVTTPGDEFDRHRKQVIYPIADLVVPLPTRNSDEVEPLPSPRKKDDGFVAAWEATSRKKPSADAKTCEDLLMALIKNSVAPRTWMDNGGKGSIQYFPLGMALVVEQTQEVQEQVRDLLTSLRKLQELNVAIEMRIVSAAPEAIEEACNELKVARRTMKVKNEAALPKNIIAPTGKRWSAQLTEKQTYNLLDRLQGERSTQFMQAPKVTTFNGQSAVIEVSDQKFFLTSITVESDGDNLVFKPQNVPYSMGVRIGMSPIVSGDRRSVRLRVDGSICNLAGPVAMKPIQVPNANKDEPPFQMFLAQPKFTQVCVKGEFAIPDSGTRLVHCGRHEVEVTRDDWVSIVNCLLTGKPLTRVEDRATLFLFTPRIIVNEVEEQPVLEEMPSTTRRP